MRRLWLSLIAVATLVPITASCGAPSPMLPRACFLLTAREASRSFRIPMVAASFGNRHSCGYVGAVPRQGNQVSVTLVRGVNERSLPSGSPVSHPIYVPLRVAGRRAYWVAIPPNDLGLSTPTPHGAGDLTTNARGYLVRVFVQGAGSSQKEIAVRIMAAVLDRI
jgi:hypothetical protein